MRMRKKKHSEERLSRCSQYIFGGTDKPMTDPSAIMGYPGSPVFLEVGAGKGGFATGMMKQNPDVCYFAMERVTDCVVLAVERAEAEGVSERLKFITDTADNLTRIFAPGTVDGIFLNFSDPWSKKGYAKRRLTHRRYLAVYMNLLRDGGKLRFKTDNVGLFDFSLEEIEAMGLKTDIVTRDLHNSPYSRGNVVTEYEAAFSSQGVSINMLEVSKPKGFEVEIPADLRADRVSYMYGKADTEI